MALGWFFEVALKRDNESDFGNGNFVVRVISSCRTERLGSALVGKSVAVGLASGATKLFDLVIYD